MVCPLITIYIGGAVPCPFGTCVDKSCTLEATERLFCHVNFWFKTWFKTEGCDPEAILGMKKPWGLMLLHRKLFLLSLALNLSNAR